MRLNQSAIKLAQRNARRVEKEKQKEARRARRKERLADAFNALIFSALFALWVLVIVAMRAASL